MTGGLKLYEHVDDYQVVLDWMDEHDEAIRAAGGELPPELDELFAAVVGDVTAKAESCALVYRNLAANASAADAEAKRLAALAQGYTRQAETFRAYIQRQMERAGIPRIDGPRAKLWLQKNGAASVRPKDADVIPLECRRVRVEFDARAAMELLKARGVAPEPEDGVVEVACEVGALLVQRGVHLRIK
jgi:hypothetical protein